MPSNLIWAIVIALALTSALLIPYLIKEIRDGKAEFGPLRRFARGKVVLGPQTPGGLAIRHPTGIDLVAAKTAAEDHVAVAEARRCHRARHAKTHAPPRKYP